MSEPVARETREAIPPEVSGRRAGWRVFTLLLALLVALNIWMTGPYLVALLTGGMVGMLAAPWNRALLKRGLGPSWSAGLVTFAVLILIVVPLGIFVTIAIQEALAFGQDFGRPGGPGTDLLRQAQELPWIKRFAGNPQQLTERIQGLAAGAGSQALAVLGSLPDRILQAALAMLTCFFTLADGRKFVRWLNTNIPLDQGIRSHLYGSLRDTAISTTWATLAAAGAQAAVMFVAYLVLRVPGAFLAAGATFIFAWIPLVGSTPVWLGGALYLYFQDAPGRALAMIAFGIVTGLVDNFVRPLVLKGRSDMHPLVSLVAIFGGIQLFGLLGVFFGPILMATAIALLATWTTLVRQGPASSAEEQRRRAA